MQKDMEDFDLGGCPRCATKVPKFLLLNVRGKLACIKCHFDYLWDFIEENRRNQRALINKFNPPPKVDWGEASKEEIEKEIEKWDLSG